MELLHRQAFFYEAFCGSAAKYEAQLTLHEAALRAMKQSLTASFRHFFGKNAFMRLPSFHSGYPAFLQKKWRRERDSNPRTGNPVNDFRDRRLRPLSHLSAEMLAITGIAVWLI